MLSQNAWQHGGSARTVRFICTGLVVVNLRGSSTHDAWTPSVSDASTPLGYATCATIVADHHLHCLPTNLEVTHDTRHVVMVKCA